MELDIFKDVVIIFGLSVVVLFIFHKLRIPLILGFLMTGILAGPNGFQLIENVHEVEILAEIGVILLMFTIGIEFSLANLAKVGKTMLLGGSIQVFLTIIAIYFIASAMGNDFAESTFIGFLIALSSTAIVLKLIQDKGEIDTQHGRTSLSILIFQDIIIVPMILITPMLAGNEAASGGSYLWLIVKFIGVVIFVLLGAKYAVPQILYQITKTQSREIFLLSIILIGFAVALLTYSIGLSLALGAFLAGLMISESKYSQQALGNITPFLDVFASFFFVSIGMLMDIDYFLANPLMILLFTTIVLSVKTFIAGFAAFLLGFPLRTCLIVGFTLSQVGEFSFILSKIGISEGILSEENYQLFLDVSIMSMAATPLVINFATKFSDYLYQFNLPNTLKHGLFPKPVSTMGKISDHLIIVGYGVSGKNVAKAAKFANIPHVIIELNPATVRREMEKGEIIHYGDATQPEVLEHANISDALILVSTIPGPADTKRLTSVTRKLNPHVHLIIRTRFYLDMKVLYDLGADEVIPEEFETSVEIFTRVLAKYLIPKEEIEKFVAEIRSDGYEMFRSLSIQDESFNRLSVRVPQVDINSIHVCSGSPVIGKKIGELEEMKTHKLNLLAISRGQEIYKSPRRSFELRENDILFFLERSEQLKELYPLFKTPDLKK